MPELVLGEIIQSEQSKFNVISKVKREAHSQTSGAMD